MNGNAYLSVLEIFSLLISIGSRLLPVRLMKTQHELGRVLGRKSPRVRPGREPCLPKCLEPGMDSALCTCPASPGWCALLKSPGSVAKKMETFTHTLQGLPPTPTPTVTILGYFPHSVLLFFLKNFFVLQYI